MKKRYCIAYIIGLFLVLPFVNVDAKNKILGLVCEYRTNPIGIDIEKPRLSWKIDSDQNDVKQTAYEIWVAGTPDKLKNSKELIWSSGKIESNQSVNIDYQGKALNSGQRLYWKVRIWDNKGKASTWSEVAYWEMGILHKKEWKASWITKNEEVSEKSLPAQYYRREFNCNKEIASARAYVTSLGLYQLYINGNRVGDQLFTPGFTSYKKRIQYQTYDITGLLLNKNAVGAIVGDGWYRGYLGWEGGKAYYGDKLALFVQIQINYTDGSKELILSDENWKTSYGAILESDIYNGEKYDARLEWENWTKVGFSNENWDKAEIFSHPKDILVASNSLPVKAIEEIVPIQLINTPKGELVLDLGQNIVGRVRMKVSGKKGDVVKLQFAEVLDKEGNFYTTNLRTADATDIYTLKGGEEEVYEPYFTFHGFRFIKLEGYPGELTKEKITGIVIHSEMDPTGDFTCSDTLINKLQKNIQWGQRCNFLDIPTDCPQRDERVGWTGDAQVFSMTAAYNFNVAPFFTKWLNDLSLDQQPNGEVPNIIPDMWNNKLGGTTGWGDAAVIVPWTVYRKYNDKRILEQQYPSMKAWVEYMRKNSGDDNLWNQRKHHWGDWLSYNTNKPGYPGAYTETDLIATAYYCYSTTLLSKIAGILEKHGEAAEYKALAEKIKEAFAQEYITPNGRLVSHTQTAYALALWFNLVPEELEQNAAKYFAADVKKFKHLTTGFLGTPLLCKTLSKINRDDLAFMLLNRKDYPSWLYPVTQGATTIWERWDTQKPDGTIIDGMNSFNHYAYGAIGEWLYSHVAGLALDKKIPGYKHIQFNPNPGGGIENAKASYESMYGLTVSEWHYKNGEFIYNVIIPPNTTGTVTLPKAKGKEIKLNNKIIGDKSRYSYVHSDDNVVIELGSGDYTFRYFHTHNIFH